MDVKQYLKQLRRLDDLVNAKLEQVYQLKSLTERVTGTLSVSVNTSTPTNFLFAMR